MIFVILFILLAALAATSGAESAILAANRLRARHRAETGQRGPRAVSELLARKEDFLPVLLAFQTLLTVALSTLAAALSQSLRPGTQGLFLAALAVTLAVLIFGEILPKTVASHRPDHFAYLAAPSVLLFTRVFSVVLRPLTWVLRGVLNLTGRDSHAAAPSEKELKYLISLSRAQGVLQKEEEELLGNIFDFTDSKAGEIMVPRTRVKSVEAASGVPEVLAVFARTHYSRLPVYEKNPEHIVGIADVRDILAAQAKGEHPVSLTPFITPAVFIPESKRVGRLLQEMRREGFRLAIVIDEYGGMAGLVTLTDLIEEIVGTLERGEEEHAIRPVDEKTLVVPASASIEEVERRLLVSLPHENLNTIGGLVFSLFGRVPEQGEQIGYQNVRFTVTRKKDYRLEQITVVKEGKK